MKGRKITKDDPVKFLAYVPPILEAKLREEAARQRRNRNSQLIRVLEERYGLATDGQNSHEQPSEVAA